MRIASVLLLCFVGAVTAAGADEAPHETAIKVRAAYDAANMDALRSLARDPTPDPWLVADALCVRGSIDAALAYAGATERQDAARLPEYLEGRKKTNPDIALRGAIMEAQGARSAEARTAALAALEAHAGQGDVFERVLAERSRGSLLASQGRAAESAEAFTTAGRLAERIGWLSMAAEVYRKAGLQAHADDNIEGMLAAWSRLLAMEAGRGDQTGIGRALTFLGNTFARLGDYEQALRHFEQAEATFGELKDGTRTAWVLDNMGHVLQRRGEYSRALDVLQRGLELARAAADPHRVAQILSNLGGLHSSLHDLERSLAFHQEALGIFTARQELSGIAQCVGNIGSVYGKLGQLDKGLEHLTRAVESFRALEDDRRVVVGLVNVGSNLEKQARLDDAKRALLEALELARRVRDEFLEVHALQQLADVLVLLENYEGAEQALDQGMRLATRLAVPPLLMENHRGYATLWLAKKSYGRAVHASQRALEYTLTQLVGLAPDQAAIARDSMAELFEVSLQAAVASGRPEAVFSAIEGARAGALLESLENRDAIRKQYVPEALRDQEREANLSLGAAARAYQKALAGGKRTPARQAGQALEAARGHLQGVIGEIQREARAGARVLYPVAASLEEAQELLAPSEALVSYSLMADPPVALVVTSGDARIVVLGPREDIIDAARAAFGDPRVDVTADVARLGSLLIKPLALPGSVRRVLIAPDGILGYVPFALLTGDRQVAYVPSATALRVLRSMPGSGGSGVLALGDPDYQFDRASAAPTAGMRLAPLPATRAEATAVGDVVLLGTQATAGRFLMTVGTRARWRALHLACHGLVDSTYPMRSALALAFEEDRSNLLSCAEVFSADLPADLAVLSACETGRGTVYRVEGIVGLTQAFMAAGSPRVLVSLWKVDDEATRALMEKFYELWNPVDPAARLSAVEALSQAQAFVRGHPAWRHPYFWGAWVLWGRAD